MVSRRSSGNACVACAGILAALVASSGQPFAQQEPTFRGGVNVVSVDVVVTDKDGKPVDDLKATDFEVSEAGKAQTIDTFKLVSVDGGVIASAGGPPRAIRSDEDLQTEAARTDVRLFAMFLDDYHVKRGSSLTMRDQIARFIDTQLGPSDIVGVMHPLDPIDSVRMNRNLDQARRQIVEFVGRKHDYFPKNDAEAACVFPLIANLQVDQIEQMRNRISFDAIRSLIARLGAIKEGRKVLILVSEGYADSLPAEMRQYAGGLGLGLKPANAPVPAGCGMPVSELQLNIDLQELFTLANRNNVAIYPVDPRGLAATEYGLDFMLVPGLRGPLAPEVDRATDKRYLTMTMDTLRTLAEGSGGRAIVNRNDLTPAMKQILVDSSAYYLLGYRSTLTTPDGKFHPISVKVKRSGVEVRHRPGYWSTKLPDATTTAATAAAARAPAVNPVETALAASATPRNRSIRTWIGTSRGANGTTHVMFVWEPAATRAPGPVPARVLLTAVGADGSSLFRGRTDQPAGATAAGGAATFDAPPGTISLRLSVEGAQGEVVDSEVRDVVIPDFTASRLVFGTPEVFRARTVVELQRIKTDTRAMPTAAREFTRTERLLLRVATYGPSGLSASSRAVAAQLLNRAGQVMQDLPVSADDARTASLVEVSLASLSPSEYAVQFGVPDDVDAAKEIVAFRVVP